MATHLNAKIWVIRAIPSVSQCVKEKSMIFHTAIKVHGAYVTAQSINLKSNVCCDCFITKHNIMQHNPKTGSSDKDVCLLRPTHR